MTMVVETGVIVAGANSYTTTSAAELFFENTGDTVWLNATEENQEYALIKGALYMQQKYRLRWKGSRMDAFQALDWPRRGVDVPDFFDPFYANVFVPIDFRNTIFVPSTFIPPEVKHAQCLLARATMDSAGVSNVTLQPALGRVTKREKLGDLEVEYMDGAAGERLKTVYWDAHELLRPYLRPDINSGTIVRS